ncbi:flagellar assembly protein H [Phormidesmis priestleyi]
MTQIPFDQLAKQFLPAVLTPLSDVERSLEVPGESKFVDVWFEPATTPEIDPASLGVLGKIATTPCLIEPFRNPPTRTEVRTCLLKLLWVQEEEHRQASRQNTRLAETGLSQLWILASSVSRPLLEDFGVTLRDDWVPGIYFLANALKSAIVSIDQLPEIEETLWLRILGRDTTQRRAIAEVIALPQSDPRRAETLQMLTAWKVTIEMNDPLETEDEALLIALSQAYLEWEQTTEQRGEQRGERKVVESLLRAKFGELDASFAAIVPQILSLPTEEYTVLLLQLSREELLARFARGVRFPLLFNDYSCQ